MRFHSKKFSNELIRLFFIIVFLLLYNFFLYKIFSVRALSFGCFDDCANYMAGYFMLHGKTLYTEVFYNHIMGVAWLSFFVQKLHPGINLYDLILVHRQAIMLMAFIFDVLIIKRFKWTGLWFVILYELCKFYIFGDRFLGESIVVYAAVYLVGLVWEKYSNHALSLFDYIMSGVLVFLIIIMREPYIPLALVLYLILLWGKFKKPQIVSVLVCVMLLLIVAVNTDLQALFFNDFTVNFKNAIVTESSGNKILGIGIFQVFFYPVFLFLYGRMNAFRIFEVCISLVFVCGVCYEFLLEKKRKLVIILLLILGFANLRITPPGTVFFEAYHMLVWFGMFLFIALLFCSSILKKHIRWGIIVYMVLFLGWVWAVFSPSSYLYNKIDLQEQLLTNFGNVMNVGNVVRNISSPTDTLFLDGGEDTIYWVSHRYSPYKYSWYTSVMPTIPLYTSSRMYMFHSHPPTFYYDFCSKEAPLHPNLPIFVRPSYQQLLSNGKPSCLYVLKSKLSEISTEQWKKAEEGFYSIP